MFGEGEDFHAGRGAESGLTVLNEIEDCGLLAAWHPDGRGWVRRGFAACAGSRTASGGLNHGGYIEYCDGIQYIRIQREL